MRTAARCAIEKGIRVLEPGSKLEQVADAAVVGPIVHQGCPRAWTEQRPTKHSGVLQ